MTNGVAQLWDGTSQIIRHPFEPGATLAPAHERRPLVSVVNLVQSTCETSHLVQACLPTKGVHLWASSTQCSPLVRHVNLVRSTDESGPLVRVVQRGRGWVRGLPALRGTGGGVSTDTTPLRTTNNAAHHCQPPIARASRGRERERDGG